MMALYGIVAGTARRIAINGIEKRLRESGALSADTAVTPEEAGLTSRRESGWVNRLIGEGKVGKTKDGKIWWKG